LSDAIEAVLKHEKTTKFNNWSYPTAPAELTAKIKLLKNILDFICPF
jgi:hypothetical protein